MQNSVSPHSWAFEAALCLLAPFFFLSTFFTILSPLPILYLHQGFLDRRRARLWAFAALPIGASICGAIAGPFASIGFLLFAGLPAFFMGELLERRFSLETVVTSATVLIIVLIGIFLALWFYKSQGQVIPEIKKQLSSYVTSLANEILHHQKTSLSETSRKEIEKLVADPDVVLNEAGGLLVAGILLLCTIPVVALLRWNPKNFQQRLGLKRDYIRRWTSPEWLVWPSLAAIAFLIFDVRYLSIIAANLIKPLLLVYFLHGMSILSFYLDLARIRGPIRFIIYTIASLFLAPMVVSFGFFDLWFKFRDRTKPEERQKI